MPELITDPRDARVADFHDLHAGDRRPGTARGTGPVVVEGVTAVERLLETGLALRAVYGVAGRLAALDLPAGVPAYEADKWVVSETIGFRLTRGVLASAERPVPPSLDDVLARSQRIAVLEGLNDHENIGSIGRSAVALGVDALLLDPTCADPYYRRSVRVSMGHLLTLPVLVLADWPGDLGRVRAAGFTTVALTPDPGGGRPAVAGPGRPPPDGAAARRGGPGPHPGRDGRGRRPGADPDAIGRGLPGRGGRRRGRVRPAPLTTAAPQPPQHRPAGRSGRAARPRCFGGAASAALLRRRCFGGAASAKEPLHPLLARIGGAEVPLPPAGGGRAAAAGGGWGR